MGNDTAIEQISKLLLELSSDNYTLRGVPSYNEAELDGIIMEIKEQDYKSYNKLFKELQNTTISIDYLKSVFRGIVDMLLVLKPDYTIFQTNSKVCDLLGYKKEELINHDFQMLFPEQDNASFQKIHQLLDRKGYFNNLEQNFKAKDGRIVPISSSSSLLYARNSDVNGVLYIVKDLSKIKKAEKQLRSKNEELNTFVYKASHDLKGPLASISGLVNLAKDKVDDPQEIKHYIELIGRSIGRLDYTLNELLEVTRIGQGSLNYSEIDLEGLISEILASLDHLRNFKNIDFQLKIDQDAPFINDERIIRSILQNLIQNAIKYSRTDISDSFVKIEIGSYHDDASFVIEDNGIGMADEILDSIFKMFYRGSEISEGNGLGLYIVQTGLEKLGGEIDVKSKLNEGTLFTGKVPNSDPQLLNTRKRRGYKEDVML